MQSVIPGVLIYTSIYYFAGRRERDPGGGRVGVGGFRFFPSLVCVFVCLFGPCC